MPKHTPGWRARQRAAGPHGAAADPGQQELRLLAIEARLEGVRRAGLRLHERRPDPAGPGGAATPAEECRRLLAEWRSNRRRGVRRG